MGCIFGKSDTNGRRIFRVYNVDENGEELNNGKIEVTDTDLVLYHRGKEIQWPLRCLRRYGWEEELFSFESGRRCQTGPGIYAFKCKRAELLFNSVQECIRRAGQVDPSPPIQGFEPSVPSRPNSVIELNDFSVRNGNVPNGNPLFSQNEHAQNYVNQPDPDQPQYINTKFNKAPNRTTPENNAELLIEFMHEYTHERDRQSHELTERERAPQNYAVLEFSSSGDENSCTDEAKGDRNHSARGLEETGDIVEGYPIAEDDVEVFLPENPQNDYLNVGVEPGRPPLPKLYARDPNYSNVTSKSSTINYISVDSSGSRSVSVSTPQTLSLAPQTSGCPYSLIDPDRTKALQESGNWSRDDCDEKGVRKTRHDSTFNDM